MAQAAGGAGRTGPYWRRQLGTTLPGERTGQQLNLINAMRAHAGLPPVGGATGDDTRFAQPQGGDPHGIDNQVLLQAIAQEHGHTFNQGLDPMEPGMGEHYPIPGMGGQQDEPMEPGGQPTPRQPSPMQSDHDLASLREQLLHRVMGGVAPTSRDALRQYVGQQQLRQAHAARRQHPILPQRPGMRAAHQRGPAY